MRTYAAIDLGSNSILLLIGRITDDGTLQVVLDTGRTTRLGRGVTAGTRLHEASVQYSLDSMRYFVSICHKYDVKDVIAVGTQALRLAGDAQEFVARVKNDCGLSIRIISFEEEARLSYLAVAGDPSMPAPAVVMDVGGGSTEFLLPSEVPTALTIPVGSVVATEEYLYSDPPGPHQLSGLDEHLRRHLRKLPSHTEGHLVGIGGTLVTMAMIHGAHSRFDPEKVHGMPLTRDTVHRLIERLAAVNLRDRKKIPGLPIDRADIIVAGALIVHAAMTHLDRHEIVVSSRGLRYGLLYEHLGLHKSTAPGTVPISVGDDA